MQTRLDVLRRPGWVAEFRAFIARGNVVDLAIGIIIGVAFTGVINSLVKDLINPLIGAAIGGIDFSNVFIALNRQSYPTLDAAQKAGAPTLNIGFINSLVNFLIIALVVFWIGKAAARLIRREAEAPSAPPAPTRSAVLLEEIRDELKARTPEAAR